MKPSLRDVAIILFVSLLFLFIVINLPNSIFYARNAMPGLRKVSVLPTCCEFDKMVHNGVIRTYEPAVSKIKKCPNTSELHIGYFSDGWITGNRYGGIPICYKSAKHLSEIFLKIIQALGLNSCKKLSFYKLIGQVDGPIDPRLIVCEDKLVCISVRDWILPLACRTHSLAGHTSPLFNIKWKFCSFRTSPIGEGYVIDPYYPMEIRMETLCKNEIKIVEIEKTKFFFRKKIQDSEMVIENNKRPFNEKLKEPFDGQAMLLTLKNAEDEWAWLYRITFWISHGLVLVSVLGAWCGIIYTLCRKRRAALSSVDPLFIILSSFSLCGMIYLIVKS